MTTDLFEYLAEETNPGTVSVSQKVKGGKWQVVGKFLGDSSDEFQEQFGAGDFKVKVYKRGGSGLVGQFEVYMGEARRSAQPTPEPQNNEVLEALKESNRMNALLMERLEKLNTQQTPPAQVDPFAKLKESCNEIKIVGQALNELTDTLAGNAIKAAEQKAEDAEARALELEDDAKTAKAEAEKLRRDADSDKPGAIAKAIEKVVEKGVDKYGDTALEAGQSMIGKAMRTKKAKGAIHDLGEARA